MRKILFTFAVAGLALVACNNQSGYTVTGNIEGLKEGKAYMVNVDNGKVDTLASSDIKNGNFTFKGNVKGITAAFITVQGQRGGLPIFLENEKFTVKINPMNPMETSVKGGAAQKLNNEFNDIQLGVYKQQQVLNQSYMQAQQAQNQAKADSIANVYNQLVEKAMAKEDSLIKANPDSYVSAHMVAAMMGEMELEALKGKYALLGENAKATIPGQKIAQHIARQESVAIGQIAPNFTLDTPEGGTISLYDIKGKVKLIDFWASWCGPCRQENPHVVALYKEFHPKGLEIIGVSLDNDKANWEKAIQDDGLTWYQGSDLKGWQSAVAQLYGVRAIPHTVLLDANNKIVAKNLRGNELKAKIAEMLK
ncbi:TlpA disulfide reductase family protein [Gabonibacter chumensis]|uniref:TlpA disulfide reductase family protein n=1 Tax=Gabonibacter chumensis TaxID=2972474 RepID=UPI00257272F2|nr:TlpA disulfide reductase family protein [Gabonibacter chumensis]MCR9010656.1 AhpC/TSA family protein [Gabonibacter chumensis]